MKYPINNPSIYGSLLHMVQNHEARRNKIGRMPIYLYLRGLCIKYHRTISSLWLIKIELQRILILIYVSRHYFFSLEKRSSLNGLSTNQFVQEFFSLLYGMISVS